MILKLRICLFSAFFVLLTNIAIASDVIQVIGQTGNDNSVIRFRMPLYNDLLNDVFNKVNKTNIYSEWGVKIDAKTIQNFGNGDVPVTVFVSEFKKVYYESDIIDIPVYTKGKLGNYVYNFLAHGANRVDHEFSLRLLPDRNKIPGTIESHKRVNHTRGSGLHS